MRLISRANHKSRAEPAGNHVPRHPRTSRAGPTDRHGLVAYVEATGAKRILTVHGFAVELATQLRDRGFDAQPLDPPRQLELF